MTLMTVQHMHDDRFTIAVRGHEVVVDQPRESGGTDTGPSPTELFVAGLASCVAFYCRRFLARHDLPEQLVVRVEYDMSEDRPARVAAIRLEVDADVPAERQVAFLRVLEHCTVHNSLRQPPSVDIDLAHIGCGAPQRQEQP